tara:strand:- start:6829 stop:7122 length:294 start_codon:yes stop_codon:yes gene_type:complete
MVDPRIHNDLVGRYNDLLQSNALRNNKDIENSGKEIHKGSESISISDNGIVLESNVIAVDDLSKLLIEMLKDKTIKKYMGNLKEKKIKKVLEGTYLG